MYTTFHISASAGASEVALRLSFNSNVDNI